MDLSRLFGLVVGLCCLAFLVVGLVEGFRRLLGLAVRVEGWPLFTMIGREVGRAWLRLLGETLRRGYLSTNFLMRFCRARSRAFLGW